MEKKLGSAIAVSTTTDYVSSVSLLPTIEFLELVAKKQWDSSASYGLGISTIVPMFHSTTNSEWLCLNTEAEFLEAPIGTISIKNPFAYTRPESSPVYVGYNDVSISSTKANKAKSLYLFRIDEDGKNEVIMVSNYDKKPDNVTSAPPIDCFSRECLTWFSSDVDWFTGFGTLSGSLSELIVEDNGIVTNKSEDILTNLIPFSTKPVYYSNISFSTVTTLSPFVTIKFASEVEYVKTESTPDYNVLFLYNSDSLVAFAGDIVSKSESFYSESLKTKVYFDSQEIIII